MVSHDRFFLDRIVDHLFVFKGDGVVRDFPGDYSTYRHCVAQEQAEQRRAESQQRPAEETRKQKTLQRNKLTFKEKREREEIESRLPALEEEKRRLEQEMSAGTMDHVALAEAAARVQEIMDEIDTAELRLLELMEKEEG